MFRTIWQTVIKITFVVVSLLTLSTASESLQAQSLVGVIISKQGQLAESGREVENVVQLFSRGSNLHFLVMNDDDGNIEGILEEFAKKHVDFVVGPISVDSARRMRPDIEESFRNRFVWISLAPERPDRGSRPANYFRIGTSEGRLLSRAIDFSRIELKAEHPDIVVPPELFKNKVIPENWSGPPQRLDFGATQNPRGLGSILAQKEVTIIAPQRLDSFVPNPSKAQSIVTYSAFGLGNFRGVKQAAFLVTIPGSDQTPASKLVAAAYEARFGQSPNRGFAFQTYAALEIISAVGKRTSTAARIGALASESFETVIGEIQFKPDGDSTWHSEVVWAFANGVPRVAASGGTSCKCSLADCCAQTCCKDCKGECN